MGWRSLFIHTFLTLYSSALGMLYLFLSAPVFVCMCVYVCEKDNGSLSAWMRVWVCVCARKRLFVVLWVWVCARVCVYMCERDNVSLSACVCVCVCVCVCTCLFVFV